jgi:2-haloacid dehalogenase
MPSSRRQILITGGIAAATFVIRPSASLAVERPRFKAIAFDGFAIFDTRSVAALAEDLFPGSGNSLMVAWRTRQFEYTWLRVMAGRYSDFRDVTEDSLFFASAMMKLNLTAEKKRRLVDAFSELKTWPDVIPALTRLQDAGVRLAFLTNLSPKMLQGCINSSGIAGLFEHSLSTDAIRSYKPDPRTYQLGPAAFALPLQDILFVAFAGWDAAGAKSYGYPTFWLNRLNLPREELGFAADAMGSTSGDIVTYVDAELKGDHSDTLKKVKPPKLGGSVAEPELDPAKLSKKK